MVPVIPSPLDLWASVGIRKVIENVGAVNESMASRLLLNQCRPNTTLAREVTEVLPEYGIPLCQTYLGQREVYRQSPTFGQTVFDFGRDAAAAVAEMDALTTEVLTLLEGR
jgi:chromosome partitioning protein